MNGSAVSGQYLRGNGTNFVSSAIQVSDVPTLNQNTTGNAATATTTTNLSGGSVSATTGSFSGKVSFNGTSGSGSLASSTSNLEGLKVSSTGSDGAFIGFYRPSYSTYLGLDNDNVLKYGGGSLGSVASPIITSDNYFDYLNIDNSTMQGRLTLSSGNPNAYVSAQTVLYYTPYNGNIIFLYNTTKNRWESKILSEINIANTGLTTNANYDVFVYDNSGTLTLELLAWTNSTTRVALTTQDGVYVKTGSANKRFVGSIRTSATGTFELSSTQCFVYNYYNPIRRYINAYDGSAHIYATAATRAWRGVTTLGLTRTEAILGNPVSANLVDLSFYSQFDFGYVSVTRDNTTTLEQFTLHNSLTGNYMRSGTSAHFNLASGYHFFQSTQHGINSNSNFLLCGHWIILEA